MIEAALKKKIEDLAQYCIKGYWNGKKKPSPYSPLWIQLSMCGSCASFKSKIIKGMVRISPEQEQDLQKYFADKVAATSSSAVAAAPPPAMTSSSFSSSSVLAGTGPGTASSSSSSSCDEFGINVWLENNVGKLTRTGSHEERMVADFRGFLQSIDRAQLVNFTTAVVDSFNAAWRRHNEKGALFITNFASLYKILEAEKAKALSNRRP